MRVFGDSLSLVTARLSGGPRKALALLCLVGALWSALQGHPRAAAEVPVAVAAHKLAAGAAIAAADLRVTRWPPALVPALSLGSVRDLIGRRVSGTVDEGEPITGARLLDTAVTDSLAPGEVAMTIRIDNGGGDLIGPGALIDLYRRDRPDVMVDGTPLSSAASVVVSRGLRVLAVAESRDPPSADPSTGQTTIVVAIARNHAADLTNSASTSFLATLLPPSEP